MSKIDDGVVKYSLDFQEKKLPNEELCFKMETLRKRLYALRLIGAYSNGVGYGNISHRDHASDSFYITATQTGELENLEIKDYSYVKSVDFKTFKTFVMKGHFEGVVTFGKTLDEAEKVLYELVGECLT